MDIIFKISLLSLKLQWELLALLIIPIFLKNNVMKKKKHAKQKHLNSCHCMQQKQHIHGRDQKSS